MGGGQREEEGRLRQGGQEIAGAEGDAGAAAAANRQPNEKSRPAMNRAVNAGCGRLVSASPGFSSSMPLPNRPPQQSAREIVKSAPKKEGPGGGCAPGPSSPDPFLGGFDSRPPLL
jgi:hypothetical protein